jgi:hypothetical protein
VNFEEEDRGCRCGVLREFLALRLQRCVSCVWRVGRLLGYERCGNVN